MHTSKKLKLTTTKNIQSLIATPHALSLEMHHENADFALSFVYYNEIAQKMQIYDLDYKTITMSANKHEKCRGYRFNTFSWEFGPLSPDLLFVYYNIMALISENCRYMILSISKSQWVQKIQKNTVGTDLLPVVSSPANF